VTSAQLAVVEAFHSEWGGVVAYVIGVTGDWDLAEDCAQDAFNTALEQWARDGVPANRAGWLKITARNRAYDILRRQIVGQGKMQQLSVISSPPERDGGDDTGVDDRLRLLFTCCHPALRLESQVALAMRTLLGLTTAEIARAFLVSEETMAKRLVRAKHKIRDAGIPYRVPSLDQLPDRLSGVLSAIYGLFNEGYAASEGAQLMRATLCDEAIRLGRLLVQLMPEDPEALGLLGLLSLMVLHNARRQGRVDAAGELITLENQDRSAWDHSAIQEGCALLDAALERRRGGPYQLLAAIGALHATAPTATQTNWVGIAALYEQLQRCAPSAVVTLNRAVAVAMAEGAAAGLALLDDLEQNGSLNEYYLLSATRADLLRRLGRWTEAEAAYRRAVTLAPTEPERRFLRGRIADIESCALGG
jgi:RNA polymerase sigma-70 factor, ECF subfamily